MKLSFLYWLLMFLWLLSGAWVGYRPGDRFSWGGWALVLFLLFLMIGLKLFGAPIQSG